MEDELCVEREGRVLRLRLNRPGKHNALTRAVLARVRQTLDEHRTDEALACVVLTATGHRYFAAGGDLRDLSTVRETDDARRMTSEARAALDAVRRFPVPVVALVNGDAIGGGAELALACDLRVMSETAHIGYVQGRLGLTSGWGGGPDLCAVVGPARALRMMARAERVPASTALAWGLADAVGAADALEEALREFIAPIVGQPRAVLCGFKAQTLAARRGATYDALRALEHEQFVSAWTSAEHWDAVERILAPSGKRGGRAEAALPAPRGAPAPDYSIRPATANDAQPVSELVHMSFVALSARDWSPAARERFLAESSSERLRAKIPEAAFAAVAVADGRVVGFVLMPTPRVLGMLFVHPQSLRQGIARSLWEAARADVEARHPEVTTVELNSTPYAIEAYRALGFAEISQPFDLDGCVATRMACWLPARRLIGAR